MGVTVTYPRRCDFADTPRISAVFFNDLTQAAHDPTVVYFTYAPQSTGIWVLKNYPADAEVVKDSTGHYHLDVDVSDGSGLYDFRVYSTGTGVLTSADSGYFYVSPNPNLTEEITSVQVVAHERSTGRTTSYSSSTYSVVGADASFLVMMNVYPTTSTTYSFVGNVLYRDENNNARTLIMDFNAGAGGVAQNVADANGFGAVPHSGRAVVIRCKAGTTIGFTTTGTFTAVTYNVEGIILKLG